VAAANEGPNEKRRKVSRIQRSRYPNLEAWRPPSVIDPDRIDFELFKFDSVFAFKDLREILIPYVIRHLKENQTVPLEPGPNVIKLFTPEIH
jgi:hypothetical protein